MSQQSTSSTYNDHGMHPDIARKIENLFAFAVGIRPRNLFIRFDLKFPNDKVLYNESEIFSDFMKLFIDDCVRKGSGDVFYLSVRERVSAFHGHRHVFLLVDGKKFCSAYNLMQTANAIWARQFPDSPSANGLLHWRWENQNNGIMLEHKREDLNRGYVPPEFKASLTECLQQASYLAKNYSKEGFGKHGRAFSSTINIPERRQFVGEEDLYSLSSRNDSVFGANF